MAHWKALFLFGLVLSAAVCRVASEEAASEAEDEEDYAEAEKAHLIVRKYFKDDMGVQGRNLTVYIDVYNAGTVTAKDVQLLDAVQSEDFTVVEGSLETSLGKIEAGSSVQHSYVIVPTKGSFGLRFPPATVSYVAELDSTERQRTKSSIPGIYIQTPVEQIQYYMIVAGRYATLGMVQTPSQWRNLAIVFFVAFVLLGGNSAVSSFKASREERTRNRALQELEKEE